MTSFTNLEDADFPDCVEEFACLLLESKDESKVKAN